MLVGIQVAPEVEGKTLVADGHGGLQDDAILAQFEPAPYIFAER